MAEPHFVSITYPLEWDPPVIHCPACGKRARKMRPNTDPEDFCPHLMMIYFHKNKECVYIAPELRQRLCKMGLMSEGDDCVDEDNLLMIGKGSIAGVLEHLGYDQRVLCLEVSFGRTEDVPIWFTTTYGFNFLGKE